jgi:hypothetical protein
MFHRTQQLRIDSCQTGQHPGIQPIVFLPALANQTHVAGMRHDHFVSQLAQKPAHPRRMDPALQSDAAVRHSTEHFAHHLLGCAQPLFRQHPASFIQYAVPARSIPQVQPIVSFCSAEFPACFTAAVLISFIAGLLYLLCFEHVDNLGAYSIPSDRILDDNDVTVLYEGDRN